MIEVKRLSIDNLESLLDQWLNRDIRPSTAQAYRKWLRAFFRWYGKRKAQITVSLIVDYKHCCLTEQNLSPRIDTQRHARESLTLEQVWSLLQAISALGSKRDSAVLHLVDCWSHRTKCRWG
jgi:hypothetical protein